MKVFFVSAPRAKKTLGSILQKLYKEITKLGYIHTSDLLTKPVIEFESEMKEGKKAEIDFYQDMVESIKKADICVFEASTPSLGVGYLVDKALSLSKPTIILFYKDYKSFLLPGIEDEKLVVYSYSDKNYQSILKKAFKEAKEKRDKRFNFFISPKLLNYLELVSKKENLTKSQFIRNLIYDHMKKEK